MITAVFTDNSDYARATGLWQWDYGQRLRIEGLKLPTAVEIHFALTEQSGDAITRVGTTKDGVTEVVIPDSLLENQAAGATYEIYAWIYLADETFGETIKRISMQVKRRPKPEAFDTPEDAELFREAIEAVNASADRAETAREGAEAAQKAAEEAAGKIEGEITGAGQIAEQVKQNAAAVAQDRQAVSQMVTETTQNARNAAEAAQAAERSSTAAKEAQTAAESAEAGATAAMEEVERDRTEVSETHRLVEQMRDAVDTDRQAVAADRRAVENTALQFGQAAQSAINAVGQAQEAAVGAVSAEGQRQTTAVQRAGTQAVSDVETAKTTAVQAVTTEGDTQTKRVQDAAAGIVADREQIAANKAGIEALHQGKADAIIETAQGDTMTLTDSSDKLFESLRVFGKSTQDGTPSVENPVPIVNAGESGSITVEVTGRNLLKPNSHNTYYEFPLKANTVMTLMTNGKPSQGGNIKFSATDGSIVWFSIEAGQTRVCRSIGNKDVKSFYDALNVDDGLEYMFAVGDIKTYTPYVEPQSLTLATPNGLPGIPVTKDGNYTDSNGQQWVCDEVDLGRGKYVQRVYKCTQDNLVITSTALSSDIFCLKDDKTLPAPDPSFKAAMCNIIKNYSNSWTPSEEPHMFLQKTGQLIVLMLGVDCTTKEKIQEIMGRDIEVYYPLLTPIERDLTPEELAAYKALHTNYPTTVITNDAGAHMEVSYVADTGNYVRNMEERLNAKLVNIQSALISQKISGGGIKVTDSSRVPVVRFAMWGKTEQVKTSGKNLIDINSLKKYEVDNNDFKASIDNGKVILEGKGTKTTEVVFFCLNKTDDLLKLNPGKYTLSFKSNMPMGSAHESKTVEIFAIIKKTDGSNDYSSTGNKGWTTFDIAEGDMVYLRFDINNGTMSAEFYDIQLEYGSSATAYEPYSGGFPSPSPDWEQPIEITDQPVTVTVKGGTEQQSITLTPPKPMTKWDKLEKVDGVWCWVYQGKMDKLTTFESKYSDEKLGERTYNRYQTNMQPGFDALKRKDTLCSKLRNGEKSDDIFFNTLGSGAIVVYFNENIGINTLEKANEWILSNSDVEFCYCNILKLPESIPLSPSEQDKLNALTMYAPETEVTNTGGCNMELTYTVDTKSYVDSKIAAISAAVLEV